jgi:predicted dehydrogenase
MTEALYLPKPSPAEGSETDMASIQAKLRVGVLGGGFMAAVHSRAARSAGAVLAGIASSTPQKGEKAAGELGFERAYADARELIEDDDIDLVHICTPNATHAELALAAIQAGKHVVCEKPLAATVTQATTLANAASAAGIVATVPFAYRFHPMVREARARVAAGETGRLVTVRGSYLQDWLLSAADDNWRVDPSAGGRSRAFGDIGSHLVDMLEFVSGERIESLAAITSTVHTERGGRHVETEDVAGAIIRLTGAPSGRCSSRKSPPVTATSSSSRSRGSRSRCASNRSCPRRCGWAAATTRSSCRATGRYSPRTPRDSQSCPADIRWATRTRSPPSPATHTPPSQGRKWKVCRPSSTASAPLSSPKPCSTRPTPAPGSPCPLTDKGVSIPSRLKTLGFRGTEVPRHRLGLGDGVGRPQTEPLSGRLSWRVPRIAASRADAGLVFRK